MNKFKKPMFGRGNDSNDDKGRGMGGGIRRPLPMPQGSMGGGMGGGMPPASTSKAAMDYLAAARAGANSANTTTTKDMMGGGGSGVPFGQAMGQLGMGGGMGETMKKGGAVKSKAPVKKMASGGSTSSTSKRADGIAQRGKTRGKMC